MSTVFLESLGKCEHCGQVFAVYEVLPEAWGSVWACSSCQGYLGNKSFGYEEVAPKQWSKTQWVGPDGNWIPEKPQENFSLGNYQVVI